MPDVGIPRERADSARDVHLDGNAAGPSAAVFAGPRTADVEARGHSAQENLVAMGARTFGIFEGSRSCGVPPPRVELVADA